MRVDTYLSYLLLHLYAHVNEDVAYMSWIYSHRVEVNQSTIFAHRVNHLLCRAWHWGGRNLLHISSVVAKTPSRSGSDGAHISAFPGLRKDKQGSILEIT